MIVVSYRCNNVSSTWHIVTIAYSSGKAEPRFVFIIFKRETMTIKMYSKKIIKKKIGDPTAKKMSKI